ncbi:Uncharacterised protein [Klebsiella variicola]|nr:Uncharacterised protein [Klebsiella variicola]
MRIPLLKNSIPVNSEKSKAEIFLCQVWGSPMTFVGFEPCLNFFL